MTEPTSERLAIEPGLVVPDPWEHVRRFFTSDPSSAYDAYIATGSSPPDAIVMEDVVAMNTSMRGRSPHSDWQDIVEAGDLRELADIDRSWNLFLTPDDAWDEFDVPRLLGALFTRVIRTGIAIGRATKVLHIKRPELIPVCDDFVLRGLGIPRRDSVAGVRAIEQLRAQRAELGPRLVQLQGRLKQDLGISRSLSRIVDVLIWGSDAASWMVKEAGEQRRSLDASPTDHRLALRHRIQAIFDEAAHDEPAALRVAASGDPSEIPLSSDEATQLSLRLSHSLRRALLELADEIDRRSGLREF